MAQDQNSNADTGWETPGGLSPIPKEELHRLLDEENVTKENLPEKTKGLADKLRTIYEQSSGIKLKSEDMDGFRGLIGREAVKWLAGNPHV
jgi:hypothetical protein